MTQRPPHNPAEQPTTQRRMAASSNGQRPQPRHMLARTQHHAAPRYAQPSMVDRLLDMLSACQELMQNIQLVRNDSTYSAKWFDGAIGLLEAVGLLQKPPMHPPENTLVIHPKRGLVRSKGGTNIWRDDFKLVEGRGVLTGAANAPSYKFEKSVYD